jgi:hypothetical protein
MRPIFRLTLAAALVMFVQDSAGAASLAFCNTYAQSAMEAVRANADNNCNFSGQRYTSNPQTHLNWCLSQDEDDVNEENGKRWRQVNACSDCRAYARQAADDAHKNAEYGCGFSGPAWGENGEGHFAWCFNGRIDAHGSDFTRAINFINQERQNRRNKVEQCKAQFSQEELAACQAFADAALVQAKSARAQASKLQACALTISNGDWHEDWDGYFGQCLHDMREATRGAAAWEHKNRINFVLQQLADQTRNRQRKLSSACGFVASLGKNKKRPDPAASFAPDPNAGCWDRRTGQMVPCGQIAGTTFVDKGGGAPCTARDRSGCGMAGMAGASMSKSSAGAAAGKARSGALRQANPGSAATSAAKGDAKLHNTIKLRNVPATAGKPSGGSNTVMTPGLLEGGGGLARGGPAAVGSPGGGAGSSAGSATSYSAGTGSSGSFSTPGGVSGGGGPRVR